MKGYEIDTLNKDKLKYEYNNDYGLNLKNNKKDIIKDYFKPRNIVNSDNKNLKR